MGFLYILAKVVAVWLDVLALAMLGRVILSLFGDPESDFNAFLATITEPVIFPVRAAFSALHVGEDSPVDIPFFTAYLLLTGLQLFLPIL